jgi:hypothetical protein
MTTWKDRTVAAASGTQTGAIVAAALGITIDAPCFGKSACVTSDGFLMADFVDRNHALRMGAFVGSVSDLIANVKRLADHMKLEPAERSDLFAAVRGWVSQDYSSAKLIGRLV